MDIQTPPFLELHNAVVQRAGAPILTVDSFRLEEREHLALLGPNGSGKSTFVMLITREVVPLHREVPPVRFRGSERATLADVKRSLGVVSSTMQDQISVHLPTADVVAGGLYGTLGVPARVDARHLHEARERAREVMELLGVDELAARDIMTLSTGQGRRVVIARALVRRPDVLVFDEPCTGLDPEGMYYVRSVCARLQKAGKEIVLVTHYPGYYPRDQARRAIEKRYGVRRRVERPALDGWRDERAVRRSFARAAHDRRTFYGAGHANFSFRCIPHDVSAISRTS